MEFMGAILAAGHGTRMGQFSTRYPKPMLPVCNKPLIQHQIEILRSNGITDILVLVGHKGFEISKVLGDGSALGVNICYVEQRMMLGIAHAVGHFEPYIDRPFLLFLGDIFFIPGDLDKMFRLFNEQQHGAVLAVKDEQDTEAIKKNYSVVLGDDGLAKRVIEKPRYTTNRLKGVGLYLFDQSIFDAIRRTPRTAMRNEYEITESIQVLIDDGHTVRVASSIIDDINVTTPIDLLHCNLMHARTLSPETLLGKNVKICPGAHIENSVIGTNVAIQRPITIRNSLIFDNTLLDIQTDLDGFVVTPEHIVDCKHDIKNVRENS